MKKMPWKLHIYLLHKNFNFVDTSKKEEKQ